MFLWENRQLGFEYFLLLNPVRTAQQSRTKSESICYLPVVTFLRFSNNNECIVFNRKKGQPFGTTALQHTKLSEAKNLKARELCARELKFSEKVHLPHLSRVMCHMSRFTDFSLGPALRPGGVMVLMCLLVCLFVCLLVPSSPKGWTFRNPLDTEM